MSDPVIGGVSGLIVRDRKVLLIRRDDAIDCEFVDPAEIFTRESTPGLDDVFRDSGLLD